MTDDNAHAKRMRKLEESEQASSQFGLRHLYMHLSALSSDTRKTHAQRHGKLYTADEVREFWADPANVEGCNCTIVLVMLNDEGKPVVPSIIERAKAGYEAMATKGYDWSK